MKEMNFIPLSTPDHQATGSLAMISTRAPGLKKSRDISAWVEPQNGGGDKMAKSDKFMWMFSS